MCCVLTAWIERGLPNPGRTYQLKVLAGRSSSPARQASAFGNGLGRQFKSLIEILRNPIAFGSSTPAERARKSDCEQLTEEACEPPNIPTSCMLFGLKVNRNLTIRD